MLKTLNKKFITLFILILLIPLTINAWPPIRSIQESDFEQVVKGLSNPRVSLRTSGAPYPINLEMVNSWYASILPNIKNQTVFPFAITPYDSNEMIGFIELRRKQALSTEAEIGYWLKYEYWKRSYMTGAVRDITNFAFGQTNITQVLGYCRENNNASIKVLLKNGFTQAGKVEKFMPARQRAACFVIMQLFKKL